MTFDWVTKCSQLRKDGASFTLITIIETLGSSPRNVGTKLIVTDEGIFWGTIGGGVLEKFAIEKALDWLAKGKTGTLEIPLGSMAGQCCGGKVTILIESMLAPPRLFIFGAGHVGQAICKTLSETPFEIFISDERPEWLQSPEIPKGVHLFSEWREMAEVMDRTVGNKFSVVLTHSHSLDEDILLECLDESFEYFGLIGSSSKWKRFKSRLLKRGMNAKLLERVTCPIGNKAIGKSPKEISISFANHILEKFYEIKSTNAHSGSRKGIKIGETQSTFSVSRKALAPMATPSNS